MFAIVNIKTDQFVYGTDYRYNPPHQRTSNRQMLTYPDKDSAFADLRHRKCGNDYKVCVLRRIEIKSILEEGRGKNE